MGEINFKNIFYIMWHVSGCSEWKYEWDVTSFVVVVIDHPELSMGQIRNHRGSCKYFGLNDMETITILSFVL